MKKVTAFFVLLDLAFAGGCLVMPRTGLEAMGAVFILIPMAALHLVTTCKKEMPAIVEILVTAGADINARDKRGATPLIAAAGNTGDDAMTVILARGADPDATDRSGNTPLHLLASDSGKKDRVKGELRLIEAGANLELANKGRMTPLMLAVKSKKTEIVKALLSAGASPDTVDDRGTPLLHTVISCQPEKLAILDAGADPSLVDTSGNTLLHCVAMNTKPGGPERLRTALSVTRTLDTRNTSGFSALDLARKYRNASVATGLMAAGARQATAE